MNKHKCDIEDLFVLILRENFSWSPFTTQHSSQHRNNRIIRNKSNPGITDRIATRKSVAVLREIKNLNQANALVWSLTRQSKGRL